MTELEAKAQDVILHHSHQLVKKPSKYDIYRREEELFISGYRMCEKEMKEKIAYLEDNLKVARNDREQLQLEVGKGLKEFIKDCPYTAITYFANAEIVEENKRLKKELESLKG